MSTSPLTASGDSSVQATKERLHRLEQDLIRQRKSADGSTTLMTIVGIIVLAVIAGFFYYGYREVSIFRDPNKIVNYAEVTLDQNIPVLRDRLITEVNESAPQWAEMLSKEALGYLPTARERLEKYAKEYADEAMKQTHQVTDDQFKKYYREHHAELQKKFEELAKSHDVAENALLDLQADLEKDLQINLQADAKVLLKEITQRNQNFKRLKDGKDLNQEAQLERRAWMLVRALRHEQLDLGSSGLPDISANGRPEKTSGPITPPSGGRDSKPPKKPPVTPAGETKKDAPKKDSAPDAGKKNGGDADKKKDDSAQKSGK
jgi:hypothetical protein